MLNYNSLFSRKIVPCTWVAVCLNGRGADCKNHGAPWLRGSPPRRTSLLEPRLGKWWGRRVQPQPQKRGWEDDGERVRFLFPGLPPHPLYCAILTISHLSGSPEPKRLAGSEVCIVWLRKCGVMKVPPTGLAGHCIPPWPPVWGTPIRMRKNWQFQVLARLRATETLKHCWWEHKLVQPPWKTVWKCRIK